MCHALLLTLNCISLFLRLKPFSVENDVLLPKIFSKEWASKDKFHNVLAWLFLWNVFLTFKGDGSEGDTIESFVP